MAKSKAQRMKEYRERKKAALGEAWLNAERKRVQAYYKPVSTLNKNEQKERRDKVRKKVQEYRKRHKSLQEKEGRDISESASPSVSRETLSDDENGVSSTTTCSSPPLIIKLPAVNAKVVAGKQRAKRALHKANNNILKLKRKNQTLQKVINTTRKKLEREKKKSKPVIQKNTPRSKTDTLMTRAGLDSNNKRFQPIRKKLIYAECISQEVNKTSGENPRKRKIVANVVSGPVMKKYRLVSELKKSTKLTHRTVFPKTQSKKLTVNRRPRNLVVSRARKRDVEKFLCRDDNSRCMPGKGDVIKEGKDQKQKRILNDYLHNLHLKFASEHSYTISLATFARYRPNYISLVNYASRNTCLCQKHQDFALKLRCMKNIGVNCLTSPDKYVESHEEGIEEDLEKIRGDKVQYKQWKRVKMNDGKERMKIVDIEKGKDEFKDEMRYQFTEFREHVSRVKAQYSAVRKMKDQLPTNHVLVQMDFAENYSCQNLDEIQSAYWNTTMVTLHPTIVYHRQPDGTLVHSSYVFVSEVLQHNSSMVQTILKDLMETLKVSNPDITHIHFWTDSPTSQYRNKSIFDVVSSFESKYKVKASWHYFEAGHGKGPCDGIGGTTKRNADNAVKQGKATIQDANDFFAWACSETSSNIKYKFIQTEDFEVTKGEVEQRTKVIVPVKGTMKIHAVVGVADGTVRTRDVSCVCPECFGETGFKDTTSCHWDVASLRKNEAQAQSTACQSSAAEPNSTDITGNTINVTSEPEVVNEINAINSFPVGSYVAAVYDRKAYIGKVLDVDSDEGELNISFMESGKTNGHFKWPRQEDVIWVKRQAILCSVQEPTPTGRSMRVFALNAEDMTNLDMCYKGYLSTQ